MKKVFALLMAIMMIAAMVGCSQTQQPAPAPEAPPVSEGTPAPAPEKELDYPKKEVEVIVPGSAGGGSDIFARMIAKYAVENAGFPKPMTVVNKSGGSGSICYGYVANQPADGYTIATVSSSFFTGPATGQSPVSPADFRTVAVLCADPNVLVVNSDSQFKTMEDLIAYAKANPGKLSCSGSSGHSSNRILFEAMCRELDIEMNFVPFESGSEAVTAVLGNHCDFSFANPGEALSQIEAGLLNVLSVSLEERYSFMPDVPTLMECGVDFSLAELRAVTCPKDTPDEVVAYLSDILGEMVKSDGWQKDYLEPNLIQDMFLPYDKAEALVQETNDMYIEMINSIVL